MGEPHNNKFGLSLLKKANFILKYGIIDSYYFRLRKRGEHLLNMWRYQIEGRSRFGKLSDQGPRNSGEIYRTLPDGRIIRNCGGSMDNIGYWSSECRGCNNLPAGSSNCLKNDCLE